MDRGDLDQGIGCRKNGTRVVASEAMWRQPLKWNAEAERLGERHRVFCSSLADVFEGNDTLPDYTYYAITAARQRLFQLIDATPHLNWLLLTKRPAKVPLIMSDVGRGTYGVDWNFADHMPNVWIGTSVEDQQTADERIPQLLNIHAKVRFLSMEPLLEPVNLNESMNRKLTQPIKIYVRASAGLPLRSAIST
jgi:protein gp37